MRFDAAIFLLALPILAIWVAWLARKSYAQLSPRAWWVSAALRLVMIAALLAALARPIYLLSSRSQHLILLIDASRSITRDNMEAAIADADRLATEAVGKGHRVSVIAFGRRPRLLVDSATSWKGMTPEQRDLLLHETSLPALRSRVAGAMAAGSGSAPEGGPSREELARRITEIEEFHDATIGEATDVRSAVRLALNTGVSAAGDARVIYLFTDANFTGGGNAEKDDAWRDALASVKSAGHALHAVPLDKPIGPEVAAVGLTVPGAVRVNQGFSADLRVASTVEGPAKIVVYRDGFAMAEIPHTLKIGENTVAIPGLNFREKGFHTIDAVVRLEGSPDAGANAATLDTRVENNRVRSLVTVPGELRVLYVDGDEAHQSYLTSALTVEGVQVDARPATGVPRTLDDLLGYDCFILANVPADKLGARPMQMIRTYVQDFGGGFIMIGGDQSFGLGGYYNTPVEEVLPVRMPIQKDLNRPSIAIELIIDKSGSMEGAKMQLAKRAAIATSEAINPRDQIGVVGFDSDAREILPLTSAGDRANISAAISTLEAGGGTFLYPAMEIAHNALQQSTARKKHVIVLSDGQTAGFGYPDMAALMAADGITISAVGVGADADKKVMEAIAAAGGGRTYFTNDFNAIPQIFTREALRASNSMLIERLILPTVDADDESLAEIDTSDAEGLPPLAGYVATTPKETARVVIVSDSGDPILARWRTGLGRTAAFTSDTKPRWAEDWIRWNEFAKFWAQLVRSVAGHDVSRDLSITAVRVPGGDEESDRLTLELRDATGAFVSDKTLELTLFDANAAPRKMTVERQAPGLYGATVPRGEYGKTHTFLWKIGAASGKGEDITVPFGFVDSFSPEFRTLGPDRAVIERIRAEKLADVEPIGQPRLRMLERSSTREVPLWPWLLAVGLLLAPLDILVRRLG